MKKLTSVLSITVVASISVLLSGCGRESETASRTGPGTGSGADSSVDSKGKSIAVIVKASESEFWQIVLDGCTTAGEELGINLTTAAPVSESQVERQISILENVISSKPDAIVLAPTQSSPLVPGIEAAMEKGIPVIIIDSKADTEQYVSFLASDNIKIGTTAADEMASALTAKTGKPEGQVGCVTFFAGASSLEKRKKGFEDRVKAQYPGIEIVDFRDAMGKTGETINFIENYLTTYKNLKGIFANNQPTGEEAVRALDLAGRKDLAVVVVDSGEQEVWGLENGFVDSMIVQQPWKMGYMGVECALKAANGEKIEKFVDTGIVAINPEMLASGAAEEYLNPVEFHKNN